MTDQANTTFSFGEFNLDAERRMLRRRGETVPLRSKTFDLLVTLIRHNGRVLSKNELLDMVWENQFVEENNLTVHVAALRKALGETKSEHKCIVTVPGKGYSFVAKVNAPTNGEMLVERRKFERIIVEEELEEYSSADDLSATNGNGHGEASVIPSPKLNWTRWLRRRRIGLIGLFVAMVVLVTGGYLARGPLFAGFSSHAPFAQHRVKQLTTNGKVGSAALSPDGKLFAYTIDDLGQKSLWLGYVDGGNQLQLRPPSDASYGTLAFAPDSSHLYFSLRDDKNPRFTLFRMPAAGGVQTKVLDDIGNFSLSPDGRYIALARSDAELQKDVVVIASIDGAERRDVASFPNDYPSFIFSTLSWSPDGTRLAVSAIKEGKPSSNQLTVIDVATGRIERLEHESLREITKTQWLPDGNGVIVTGVEMSSRASVPQYRIWHISYPAGKLSQITMDRSNYGASWHNDAGVTLSISSAADAFVSVEHRQTNNIWVAPSDDLSAARQVTFGSFGKYDGLWGVDWTTDGELIFTTSDTESQFLARMKLDGSPQKALTEPGMIDSVQTITNDGRCLVHHSNRGGDIDIWRTDIDGSNPTQLTFGGKGYHPAPSPDGRWVYYKSRLDGRGGLWRVPIGGGEPEMLNQNETSWMSFSPDGRYFAASHRTDKLRLAIFSAETNQVVKQFDFPKGGTFYLGSRWTPDSRSVAYRDANFGYWLQNVDGGEPKRMEGLPNERLYNFAWSKDGKWFAFVRGQEIRDVVLFQNEP